MYICMEILNWPLEVVALELSNKKYACVHFNMYLCVPTGAVYCDRMLRLGGFDGEGVQSGSVLVVKSHSSIPLWSKVIGQLEFGPKVSLRD